MALSLTINGNNRVSCLERDTLSIEQDASSYAATCSFNLIDESGSLSIVEMQEVLIEDGDTLFHGEIVSLDEEQITNNTMARKWIVRCQDDHIKLENVVVEIADWGDLESSDIEMLDDLFDAYYPSGIDYSTYVVGTPLEPAMTEMAFEGVTLRAAISQIAARSGGKFYVHYESGTLYFHYFDSEDNEAAFGLSDDPDYGDTFPYNEIHVANDATQLVNAIYLVGGDTAKWVTDATSISTYGRREATVNDPDLLTEAALDDFGTQFIAEHKDPKTTYRVVTAYGAGLRAGMQITLVCMAKSIDATLNINRLRIYYIEDTPYWELELGDTLPDFVASGRSLSDQVSAISAQITVVQNDIFDTDAPSAPSFTAGNLTTGVTTDADGHQIVYIRATWGSVADADLDHYEVQLADNSSFNWPMAGIIRAGETREYQWNGLKGNTSYYARVRAVDWVGNYSTWSPASPGYLSVTSGRDTNAPASPTGLTAAGARTLIGVSWNQNTEADLGYYELQRDDDDGGGSPAGAWATVYTGKAAFYIDENHSEADIAAETKYHYQVRAIDTSGNASSYASSVSGTLSQIGSDTIAANAIIAAKIAAGAITAAKIATDAVEADKIKAGAVTAAKISVSSLSAISADMGTLTAGEIRVGTGTVGSNFTGFRIFSSYIAGYNNNTAQFYVSSSDGRAYWGGGNGVLDATGIKLTMPTNAIFNQTQGIRWTDNTGYVRLWGYRTSLPLTGATYEVAAPDGDVAHLEIRLMVNAGAQPEKLNMDTSDGTVLSGNPLSLESGTYIKTNNLFLVNDTGNANMTIGMTIQQDANNNEAIALKSSDVAHGATSLTETDTYGVLIKAEGTSGGLAVRGYKDADGTNGYALLLTGYLAENANTTKSTSGYGIVNIDGLQTSSTTTTNTVADGNVFSIRTIRGGSYVALFLVDEDGDVFYDGSTSSYDSENDIALVRELSDVLSRPRGATATGRARSESLGIIQRDEHGTMMSSKRHSALLRGALLQLDERIRRLEAR